MESHITHDYNILSQGKECINPWLTVRIVTNIEVWQCKAAHPNNHEESELDSLTLDFHTSATRNVATLMKKHTHDDHIQEGGYHEHTKV